MFSVPCSCFTLLNAYPSSHFQCLLNIPWCIDLWIPYQSVTFMLHQARLISAHMVKCYQFTGAQLFVDMKIVRLPSIGPPHIIFSNCCVVSGEHDRIMPPLKAESLCSDLPECRLSVLSDCGHLSHEEAPAALLEQLVPFVGELLLQPSLAPAHMPPPAA